ncbi:OLC1v1039284C1 [Oldenlandia corymbosa var. corymbosa]|uniref:OLC1v1039284C1 n=1 Tax=Oldenlandia corymbosa var. corymbosa TaxID=529605 RepID=A0AAV1D1T3_OLDCO|nr:OLC1v1039284C1 [Oldenlandia corymbosa var. corymbosa]
MEDKQDNEDYAPRGNEWEVVSLTASTYAAAPNPEQVDMTHDAKSEFAEGNQPETSLALFMSGHFVFPPSEHENLPLEPETNEIDSSVQQSEDSDSQFVGEEGIQSDTKEEEIFSSKRLDATDEFPGIPMFGEKGNMFGATRFEEGSTFPGLNMVEKEQSFYETENFSSYNDDPTIDESSEVDEDIAATGAIESYHDDLHLSISNLKEQVDKDYEGPDVPFGAWWKRRAASFYTHAKEANTVWSIFVAAALMGLVILGQHWQQERWQVLQLKWQFSLNNEVLTLIYGFLLLRGNSKVITFSA